MSYGLQFREVVLNSAPTSPTIYHSDRGCVKLASRGIGSGVVSMNSRSSLTLVQREGAQRELFAPRVGNPTGLVSRRLSGWIRTLPGHHVP